MKEIIMNRILVIFFTIVIVFPYFAYAAEDPTIAPTKLQNFIYKLEPQTELLQGGAIAILYKGQVIYKKTFGYQRDNTGPIITSSTLFPLASLSKPVSAMALALMAQDGTINFDTKFKFFCLKNLVSLKNILSHTTGYQFPGDSQIEQGMPRQKLLETLKHQKPKYKPGTCYSYSNTTFSLIEEILNTKNLNLQSAIQKLRIALNTNGIQIIPIDPNMEVAYPHFKDETKRNVPAKTLPFPRYYPRTVPAAAGVFASIDGMIEFFKLSFGYRPDLISPKTLSYLQTPMITNHYINKWKKYIRWPYNRNKIQSYYGLGWRILKNNQYPEKNLIFHTGHISGINSFIGFMPSEEVGIIILINQNSHFPIQTGLDFWSEFLRT